MAYSNAGLRCIIPSLGGGPALWAYTSTDPHGTVEGAGYFSDGGDFGMKTGDHVIVVDSDSSSATTIHTVTGVTAGAATINAATLA